jgi:DNA-binding beta-propeller fold protein YncE
MRAVVVLLASWLAGAAAAQDAPPFAAFDMAGPAVLNDAHDLAFGPDGRLYVADKLGARIAVLDPDTLDLVDTIGEGALPGVRDISFDAAGRAAVAVTGLSAVLVFDNLAEGADPLVLNASRTEGALLHPNGRIYAMAGGIGRLLAFEGGRVVAEAEGHWGAHDVAAAPDGTIWVADNRARRLVRYSADLDRLQVLDHPRFGFIGPRYLDVDPFGRLVVADQDAHRVLLIDPDAGDGGALLGVLGNGAPGAGPNRFDDPEGVVLRDSHVYVSDSDNNRVVRYLIALN